MIVTIHLKNRTVGKRMLYKHSYLNDSFELVKIKVSTRNGGYLEIALVTTVSFVGVIHLEKQKLRK